MGGRLIRTVLVLGLLLAGCIGSGTESPIPTLSPAIAASSTPQALATLTSSPTEVPPTFTPFAPTSTPEPADATVCGSGCSYKTLQAAIDALGSSGPVIIEVLDAEHAEAGIIDRDGQYVIIRGAGPEETILQANETLAGSPDRVILIEKGGVAVLQGLTIRHGRPGVEEEHGGGVNAFGKLTIINCLITANSARGGGGIGGDPDA